MNKIRLWVLVMVTLGILTSCDGCDDTLGTREIYRRNILEFGTNTPIPVYSLGVSEAEAIAMYNRITDPNTTVGVGTGYAAAAAGNKTSVHGKITKIVVVPGDDVSCTAAGVVSIGINSTVDWNSIINARIKPAMGITQMRVPATAANAPATAANLPATAGNFPATAANLPAAAANLPAAAANLPAAAASLPAAAFA